MTSKLIRFSRASDKLAAPDAQHGADFSKATLAGFGDYSAVVHQLQANRTANAHYNTFGDIDFFIVTAGEGVLHLAQISNDAIEPGSQERIHIRQNDFFAIPPYVLHGAETTDSPATIINFAPANHSTTVDSNTCRVARDVFYPRMPAQ